MNASSRESNREFRATVYISLNIQNNKSIKNKNNMTTTNKTTITKENNDKKQYNDKKNKNNEIKLKPLPTERRRQHYEQKTTKSNSTGESTT